MKQNYIISLHSGEYDSYSMENIAITDDYDAAKRYVDEMESCAKSMKEKMERLLRIEVPKWNIENPRPEEVSFKEKKKSPEYISKIKEWAEMNYKFMENWKKENFSEKEYDMIRLYGDNPNWEISPIDTLESLNI